MKSLFSKRITDVEAPSKYTTLKVKEYKGDLEPYEYVCHFKQMMQTVSVPMVNLEAMKCKSFTQGLAGSALLWFHQLPTRSANGYDELNKFISNFSINMKALKTHNNLFTIKQKNGEPLQSYIERFNAEFINIPRCPYNVAVSAFKLGLQMKFKEDLTVKPPQNLEKIASSHEIHKIGRKELPLLGKCCERKGFTKGEYQKNKNRQKYDAKSKVPNATRKST